MLEIDIMKYILSILLIILYNFSLAQINLHDFADIHNNKIVDVEDILLSKGFELQNPKYKKTLLKEFNIAGNKSILYYFAKEDGLDTKMIGKIVSNDVNLLTVYMTTDSQEYQQMKNDLNEYGFQLVNTISINQYKFTYEKDGFEIGLITDYSPELYSNIYAMYLIDKGNKEKILKGSKKK